MDFDWSKPKHGFPADQLDRSKYASFLTDYLASFKEQSYVMNLNAEWGSGKTYFLKRWFLDTKDYRPAAYIDAWKNDFSEDPLLTVISGVFSALEEYGKKYPNSNVSKYRKKTIRKSGQFLKATAVEILKHQFKKHAGGDAYEIISPGMEGISEKITQEVLVNHKAKAKLIDSFKSELKDWVEELIKASSGRLIGPLFVFIDELDRCRPTYSIELLETVKHLFDIEDVIFVIATDTGQLQHSIKAVYGESFDSSKYLYRFFDRSFSLKKPKVRDFICSQDVFKEHLLPNLLATCDGNLLLEEQQVIDSFSALAEAFAFDLRSVKQWLDQVWAVVNTQEKRDKYIWIYLALLIAMKLKCDDFLLSYFINRNHENDLTRESLQQQYDRYNDLHSRFSDVNNKLDFFLLREVAENGFINTSQCSSAEYRFQGILPISLKQFNDFTQLMNHSNPRRFVGTWDRMTSADTPGVNKLLPMLFVDRFEKYDVKKQNYIDLIEMASDLT